MCWRIGFLFTTMSDKKDINSKEHQEAIKLHFDSILAILQCQEVLGKFAIPMTEYAISILEKSLKNK